MLRSMWVHRGCRPREAGLRAPFAWCSEWRREIHRPQGSRAKDQSKQAGSCLLRMSLQNRLVKPGPRALCFFRRVMRFVRQHALLRAFASLPFLAPDLFDARPLLRHESILQPFDLVQQQPACEKTIQPLLPRSLALHLDAGGTMMQHNASGALVDVLPAMATGAHERFLDLRFTHSEVSHSLSELSFFVRRDRRRIHDRRLIATPHSGNPRDAWIGRPSNCAFTSFAATDHHEPSHASYETCCS